MTSSINYVCIPNMQTTEFFLIAAGLSPFTFRQTTRRLMNYALKMRGMQELRT